MKNLTSLYSEKVMDHFLHPRNMGEIKDADGVGTVGNKVCGDVMRLFIKVGQQPSSQTEVIKEAKFQTLGCGAAIATSSIATEMIVGQPVGQAVKITNQAITEALDGLPPVKQHCSVLAAEAVKKAIENYQQRRGRW